MAINRRFTGNTDIVGVFYARFTPGGVFVGSINWWVCGVLSRLFSIFLLFSGVMDKTGAKKCRSPYAVRLSGVESL